ncbi:MULTISPECIES: DUF3592 domain-containing protein [unclassified Streptomyces]|uniref:DUF3592 domain-containing protein n=1 Tax=unclassified Streptomyces TaxID=2593676 RepID=UPI002E811C8F|nr:DUF3592 domain-containing protein [Streptomyces sp. NBC_00589]WTI38957.1 DUF3592 domain-containing protein [Streptomyces sp. NBC_00775]WUB27363.1 DUF3592 domain-containing protein [Streptomyces sp. NBC_00589]
MDFVFHILFPLMIVGIIWAGYAIVRRTRERRAAWESGLTAEARVTRAWARTQMVNNVARRIQYHEYDFTAADGRAVRFEEAGGPAGRGVGDQALVYYTEDRPEKATASEPRPGKDMAGAVFGLVFLGAGVIILIKVIVQYG